MDTLHTLFPQTFKQREKNKKKNIAQSSEKQSCRNSNSRRCNLRFLPVCHKLFNASAAYSFGPEWKGKGYGNAYTNTRHKTKKLYLDRHWETKWREGGEQTDYSDVVGCVLKGFGWQMEKRGG